MPMYEYQCGQCAEKFSLLQSVHVKPGETVCPHCGTHKINKLFSTFASRVEGGESAPPSAGSHGCGSGGCGCA